MAHDQRRCVVGALMLLGYAGFASVIATLIASLGRRGIIGFFRNLAILAVAFLVIYLLARWRGFNRRLTAEIEKRLRQTTKARHPPSRDWSGTSRRLFPVRPSSISFRVRS